MAVWLLTHRGDWDEILMFAAPIVIAVGAVKCAEKGGARKRAESGDD
jgi:hypothetical protein